MLEGGTGPTSPSAAKFTRLANEGVGAEFGAPTRTPSHRHPTSPNGRGEPVSAARSPQEITGHERARCDIGRLGTNASFELDVTTTLDANGANAIGSAIELDPDRTDNRARASVAGTDTAANEGAPGVVTGDGAGGDGGGGCSIAGTGRSDSMLAAAALGIARRDRRSGPSERPAA